LPGNVTEFLLKNSGAIKQLYSERNSRDETDTGDGVGIIPEDITADDEVLEAKGLSFDELKKQLQVVLESGKGREAWKGAIDKIAAFGPRRIGPNLLLDYTQEGCFPTVFSSHSNGKQKGPAADEALNAAHLCDNITYAFQLAMNQGPLCHEPVRGIAVIIEDVTISSTEEETTARDSLGRLTGEVLKTVQLSIRQGFLDWSPRLMLAMYSCEIQASSKSQTQDQYRSKHIR
jgi:ribosome assembly protein 1